MSTSLHLYRNLKAITLTLVCQTLPVLAEEPLKTVPITPKPASVAGPSVEPTGSDDSQLKALIEPLMESHQGEVSLMVRNLATGEEFQWLGLKQF